MSWGNNLLFTRYTIISYFRPMYMYIYREKERESSTVITWEY